MVIVKNTRIFIPIAIFIILLGLIFTMTVFKSLLSVRTDTRTETIAGQTPQADDVNISDSSIYFQGIISSLPNVPQRTVVNPKQNSGLNVYWIKADDADSNNTCTLYDNTTKQIYASRYITNGQFSGRPTGTMYYINKAVDQKKSLALLDSTCFKD
jgi:hypothetical protein